METLTQWLLFVDVLIFVALVIDAYFTYQVWQSRR